MRWPCKVGHRKNGPILARSYKPKATTKNQPSPHPFYRVTWTMAGKHPLSEAAAGFRGTVATVKRMDLSVAVEEFAAAREARTKTKDGRRANGHPPTPIKPSCG